MTNVKNYIIILLLAQSKVQKKTLLFKDASLLPPKLLDLCSLVVVVTNVNVLIVQSIIKLECF